MTMVDLVCVYMYIMQKKKHRRMIIQRERKRDKETSFQKCRIPNLVIDRKGMKLNCCLFSKVELYSFFLIRIARVIVIVCVLKNQSILK